MALDVYRSCSFKEKREVLDAFWRTQGTYATKIVDAARQYGPYAVLSLVVVALELALIVIVCAARHSGWVWAAVACEALTLWSLWWANHRWRDLRTRPLIA